MNINKMTDEQLSKSTQNYIIECADDRDFNMSLDKIEQISNQLTHFIHQIVKDSTPEGWTVAEIFKIIASTAESRSEGLTYNNTIIIATAIHAAQERKGKSDVA